MLTPFGRVVFGPFSGGMGVRVARARIAGQLMTGLGRHSPNRHAGAGAASGDGAICRRALPNAGTRSGSSGFSI